MWCYLKATFSNCPDIYVASGHCQSGNNIDQGSCVAADVRGSLSEVWMYESYYKGRKSEPVPSGFYLKFTETDWTPLFGSVGNGSAKKWNVKNVVGGQA